MDGNVVCGEPQGSSEGGTRNPMTLCVFLGTKRRCRMRR